MGYKEEGMTDREEQINWDEVGTVIPVGKYSVEVVQAEYKPTKENKHGVNAQLKVTSAYEEEDAEKSVDRILFVYFVMTQQGAFVCKNYCRAVGREFPNPISKAMLEEWAQEYYR